VDWFARRCLKEEGLRWRGAGNPVDDVGSLGATVQDEKKSIDEENRRQLAAMSDAQIQQEREELMEQDVSSAAGAGSNLDF
jgi:hypothetical protein